MKTNSDSKATEFKAGDGCTVCGYSDNKAHTVISVSPSGKTIWIRRDKATLLNGANSGEPDALRCYPGGFAAHFEGTQRYSYEPDETATVYACRNTKRGWKHPHGGRIITGRHEHYDFNF